MSKKECLNADWESVGYSDGSRGVHYTELERHRKSCAEYQVVPDDAAYHHGWNQGIPLFCTYENGFRAGKSGRSYNNICPEDVEEAYLSGWYDGIDQYCSPENALKLGLSGYSYNGVCPAELSSVFSDFYHLGNDVRGARKEHKNTEKLVRELEHKLTAERDPGIHRNLFRQLELAQHNEEQSERKLIALEACMSSDWFDAGFQDGEEGYPKRSGGIAGVCRSYGIGPDHAGYAHGWQQGVRSYCTYEKGLYLGQTNRPYSGVCAGSWHQRFWQGYERGRHIYHAGRYEAHPRPVKGKSPRLDDRKKGPPPHLAPIRPVQPPEKDRKPRKIKGPDPEHGKKGEGKEPEQTDEEHDRHPVKRPDQHIMGNAITPALKAQGRPESDGTGTLQK